MSGTQQAKVKSVLSGDTLILSSLKDSRNERTLRLAYVSAPRMKRDEDEAFAVESRDFLRRLVVGKVIQFRTIYKQPQGDYGIVTLIDGNQLPDLPVAEGYLKVREDAGRRDDTEDAATIVERLRMLESRAKADGRGLWDSSSDKIHTQYELSPPDTQEFVKHYKGKEIEGVVERVLQGDRVIMRFMKTPTDHVQTILLIAGIRSPSAKRAAKAEEQSETKEAEPFGEEAREFVEQRLLQRKVRVHVVGVTPYNQLVGVAIHPVGDISLFVLEEGLARCADQHSTWLGSGMSKLRQAEKKARDQRKNIWRDSIAPRSTAGPGTDAIVSRVQTADTIYIRYNDGSERRVSMSSIRQPKPKDEKQAPYGAEAKEHLRQRLIGKKVKVSVDAKRAATEGFEERDMATVTLDGKNVALGVVEAGYASVIRHKMDDPDRSPIYDDLLLAETQAQTDGKGMWSSKPPETRNYVDYSENLEKAKRLLALLSRQRRVPAIVDFVKSGSRFALLIPRENAKLTLVLSGINCPRSARNPNETSEPFGKEAHELANRRCQQRNVEIDVEDTDKSGGFIGKLYTLPNRENFAKVLLEDGFASVRVYSAEKAGNASELLAAEKKAKEQRKGMWHDYDPAQDEEDTTAGAGDDAPTAAGTNGETTNGTAPLSMDYRDVVATYVDDNCRLKVQQVSPSTTGALTSLTQAFRNFHLSPQNTKTLSDMPKTGEFVAAKFTEDGQWYRARVRRNDRENNSSEVVFVDYGNSEVKPWKELRPIGKSEFGTQALKPQAIDAALSFVQFPSGSVQYMQDARRWLEDNVASGEQLIARVDHQDARDGTLWVTLFFDPKESGKQTSEGSSVNAQIVEDGLAMVGRKLSRWERAQPKVLETLKGLERGANEQRLGMWEYGDPTGEDD